MHVPVPLVFRRLSFHSARTGAVDTHCSLLLIPHSSTGQARVTAWHCHAPKSNPVSRFHFSTTVHCPTRINDRTSTCALYQQLLLLLLPTG